MFKSLFLNVLTKPASSMKIIFSEVKIEMFSMNSPISAGLAPIAKRLSCSQ